MRRPDAFSHPLSVRDAIVALMALGVAHGLAAPAAARFATILGASDTVASWVRALVAGLGWALLLGWLIFAPAARRRDRAHGPFTAG